MRYTNNNLVFPHKSRDSSVKRTPLSWLSWHRIDVSVSMRSGRRTVAPTPSFRDGCGAEPDGAGCGPPQPGRRTGTQRNSQLLVASSATGQNCVSNRAGQRAGWRPQLSGLLQGVSWLRMDPAATWSSPSDIVGRTGSRRSAALNPNTSRSGRAGLVAPSCMHTGR